MAKRLQDSLSFWLYWERDNHEPHEYRETIPKLIKHLTTHNQLAAFEQFYVDNTQSYYKKESEKKAKDLSDDPLQFFKEAQTRIQEEGARSEAVLPVGSWSRVRQVVEASLLDHRAEWLAKSSKSCRPPAQFSRSDPLRSSLALGSFMASKDLKTLGDMYTLFSRINDLKPLEKAYQEYFQKNVEQVVKDSTKDEEMVQRLLDLKSLADNALSTSFLVTPLTPPSASTSAVPERRPDQAFAYALNTAFTLGFRARRNKPAEMIAKHLHLLLRKGQGNLSHAEYQGLLDDALALYRFSEDKDVFRTFYHRLLAKRLLVGKSASDDVEGEMLKKLKESTCFLGSGMRVCC